MWYTIYVIYISNISAYRCGTELDILVSTKIRDGTYKYVVCNLFMCAFRGHTVYFYTCMHG